MKKSEVLRGLLAAIAWGAIAILATRTSSKREFVAIAIVSVSFGVGWAEFERTGRIPHASLKWLALLSCGVYFGGAVAVVVARGSIPSATALSALLIASWGVFGLLLARWSERAYLSSLPPKIRRKRSRMKTQQRIATGLTGGVGLIAGLVLPITAIENSRQPLNKQVNIIVIGCDGTRLTLGSEANLSLTVDGGKTRDYPIDGGAFNYEFPVVFRQSKISVTAPEISADPLVQYHSPKLGPLYSDVLWKVASLGLSTPGGSGLEGYFQAKQFCGDRPAGGSGEANYSD